MKQLIFICTLFLAFDARAELFFQDLGQSKTQKISVIKFKGMRVNDECLNNQKVCLALGFLPPQPKIEKAPLKARLNKMSA